MFYRLAQEHKPDFRFEGKNKKDFGSWKNIIGVVTLRCFQKSSFSGMTDD